MGEHEEVDVLIKGKVCKIDKNMVSIIKWLNHIGAQTLYCCEGYENRKRGRCGAYVMFVVEELQPLNNIVTILENIYGLSWGEIHCDKNTSVHILPRFTLYLSSINVRNKLTILAEEYLKQQGIQYDNYSIRTNTGKYTGNI